MPESKPLPAFLENRDPEPMLVMFCLDQEEADEWGRLFARVGLSVTSSSIRFEESCIVSERRTCRPCQ